MFTEVKFYLSYKIKINIICVDDTFVYTYCFYFISRRL